MAQKITLIEYNDGTYAGDDMDPDIQYRDFVPCVCGTKIVPSEPPADIEETARRIEDMRNYAYVISSSSYSSSFSSSSETPAEELFEHHETGGDDSYTIGQTGYSEKLAQTFTPDIAHQISRVELELFDNQGAGITGTITVEIKATSAGLPTGAALASGTIDAADLNPAHLSDIYAGVTFDTGQAPYGIYISPDGTRLFMIGNSGYYVRSYSMSTPWDITTLVYIDQYPLFAILYDQWYRGLFFSPDGLKMFTIGTSAGTGVNIFELDLATPWDISTLDYNEISYSVSVGEGAHVSLRFSEDGKSIFIAENYNDAMFQMTALTTGWDLSSFSDSLAASTDVTAYDDDPRGMCFTEDGKTMYVMGATTSHLLKYNIATAWNLATDTKDSYEMDMSGDITSPRDIWCSPDGKRIIVIDVTGVLHEFNTPAIHGDWHEADMGEGYELDAATKYVLEATYDNYEVDVSEPEWVNNANGQDNYEAGTLLRHDGSNWFDS